MGLEEGEMGQKSLCSMEDIMGKEVVVQKVGWTGDGMTPVTMRAI